MNEVVTDVNTFIAGFPNLGDALEVRYDVYTIGASPERVMCMGSVVFVGA